ncbi:hypothetical protein MZD04_gp116 [Pseudomonas phage Psa21]|uniref:Uncharacterized protein n=1 Tax=Pseudomonas phage Psa21 TaxID=2530023 RepID=A0A481W5I8_9CAUD|nr:hypothetical protein MZD04_gp116 [Pseudomonas phage Psa21]QBJ02644.1 hypothetical protein PSA21_116 [Pseudomonas phage Psa21]
MKEFAKAVACTVVVAVSAHYLTQVIVKNIDKQMDKRKKPK